MAGTGSPNTLKLGDRNYELVPQRIGRIRKRLTAVLTLTRAAQGDEDELVAEGVSNRLYAALEVFIPDLAPEWELAGYGSREDHESVLEHAKAVEVARREWSRERVAKLDELATQLVHEREHGEDAGAIAPAENVPYVELDVADQVEVTARLEERHPQLFEFDEPEFDDPYDESRDKSPTPPELIGAVERIFEVHGGQRLVRLLKSLGIGEVVPRLIRAEATAWARRRASARLQSAHSVVDGSARSTSSTTSEPTPATPAADATHADE